jgi:hypothetical protein
MSATVPRVFEDGHPTRELDRRRVQVLRTADLFLDPRDGFGANHAGVPALFIKG